MKKRILSLLPLALVLAAVLCAPAFALTEAEVEAQVAASSKEAVTGNVLIWFLCAVAFLKVSQKIDSFMASMGVNVGRTGGSLMAEAMIAVRGASMIAKAGGSAIGGIGKAAGNGSSSGQTAPGSAGSTGGFFKGGLIGMAGRHITNSAVKTATTQTAAVHTAQKQSATAATHSASTIRSDGSTSTASHTASSVQAGGGENTIHSAEYTGSDTQSDTSVFAEAMSQQEGVIITGQESQSAVHTDSSAQASRTDSSAQHTHTQGSGESIPNQGSSGQTSHSSTHVTHQTSIGGAVFARSLASGGKFANDVIGSVARGDIRSTGSITGDLAAQSLSSYMGHTALGAGARNIPRYSDVEIGGGRITGTEYKPGSQEGLAFGMYHAGQYAAPEGPHQKVHSADGTLWFKQYAQDAVERRPYKAPDGTVAYEEKIVKKMPTPPKRKDRI
jgi:hypothetical protein